MLKALFNCFLSFSVENWSITCLKSRGRELKTPRGEHMRIDVTKLRMKEVDDIAQRLSRLNIHTCFSIVGGRALLIASRMPATSNNTELEGFAW